MVNGGITSIDLAYHASCSESQGPSGGSWESQNDGGKIGEERVGEREGEEPQERQYPSRYMKSKLYFSSLRRTGKVCVAKWSIPSEPLPVSVAFKRLRIFLLPPVSDASSSQSSP